MLLWLANLGFAGGTAGAGPIFTATVSVAGVAYDDTGMMGTIFLEDGEAVPADSFFINGIAHRYDGYRYVALWPVADVVFYRGVLAVRPDGALVIATSGTTADRPNAAAMTSRGELLATTDAPTYFANNTGLRADGYVSMSEVS